MDRRPPLRPNGPGPRRRLQHAGGNLPPRRGTASIGPAKEAQRSTGQVSFGGRRPRTIIKFSRYFKHQASPIYWRLSV